MLGLVPSGPFRKDKEDAATDCCPCCEATTSDEIPLSVPEILVLGLSAYW